MFRRAPLAVLFLLGACEEMRTVSYGADEGVQPVFYTDTLSRLPSSYTTAEIPDGRYLIESTSGSVSLEVDTLGDGSRNVMFLRQAYLLDASQATFYREAIGRDAVEGINGLDLELTDIDLEGVDMGRCRPEVWAAGGRLVEKGSSFAVDEATLVQIRNALLEGTAIQIPFELRFHLAPEDFSALPSRLLLYVEVQPTIHVDTLDVI